MQLLILSVILLCGLFLGAAERPNVILVMTDDQGYGDLAAHGNPFLKTPHLDEMFADCVRLTDYHVSSFCTPTRAALLTGNHPGRTGAYRTSAGRTMLHRDEKTVADHFANHGYRTGMVGKWHLGDNAPHRPQDRGFQDVVWHRCGGIGQASDFWGNDYFDDVYERNGVYEKFEGYCTDVWFEEALRFVSESKGEPFFLYLAPNAPHGPYHVPDEWADPYRGIPDLNANFYGMCANIDHNMGLLQDHLDELGLTENTILIFTTDNGTAAGAKFKGLTSEAITGFNAGMRGKKSSIYEGGQRVPFLLRWPGGGFTGGREIDSLAAHIDVLPTLAELCDLPAPGISYDPDGISLAALLLGEQGAPSREHHVIQFHGGAGNTDPIEPLLNSVVLTKQWRLMHNGGGEPELYDITADPAQRENVFDQHPEVVTQLKAIYEPFWKTVSPRLTPVSIDLGNPDDNPTVLCSQDWHVDRGNPPWNFASINKLPKTTRPWMVRVQQAGRYRLTLRQFPEEAKKPVVAVLAKVEIAGLSAEAKVEPGATGVPIEMTLPAGETQLLTYLTNKKGEVGGAYFTEVEFLGE